MRTILLSLLVVACQAPPNTIVAQKGAIDPMITQDNIHETICIVGYTKTVRPPSGFTKRLKIRQMQERNLGGVPADYEEDHIVPLEVGGAPADEANLEPDFLKGEGGAHQKDKLENKLHRLVCRDVVTLDDAQRVMRGDWHAEYGHYMGM